MATRTPFLRVPYKTVSSVPIPTDVYLPSTSPKPCPVLIMIHGGAFMLGHAGMNNKDQIQDCLERGWIVLAIEHRLCPGVNLLEGPMTDVRDVLAWTQNGGLKDALKDQEVDVDAGRVMIMGTSSGGHLALSTAWSTLKPPLAILDFYGAKNFSDPFWSAPLSSMPPSFSDPLPASTISAVHAEKTILIGGVSLEGQSSSSPTPSEAADPALRNAFAMHTIATGAVIPTIFPPYQDSLKRIDPMLNVTTSWPPVAIVHGTADQMIPMRLSKAFAKVLSEQGVETEFFEVEGEPHTFCGKMVKGSATWDSQRRGFDWLEGVLERSHKA